MRAFVDMFRRMRVRMKPRPARPNIIDVPVDLAAGALSRLHRIIPSRPPAVDSVFPRLLTVSLLRIAAVPQLRRCP